MSSRKETLDDITDGFLTFLEKHPDVHNVQLGGEPFATETDVHMWERMSGYRLPEDLKSFLFCFDGLHLTWDVHHKGEYRQLGRIHVNSLTELKRLTMKDAPHGDASPLSGQRSLPVVLPLHPGPVPPAPRTRALHPDVALPLAAFDLDASCGAGKVALVYLEGVKEPVVWFQEQGGEYNFMASSFSNYLRLLVAHWGILHWQRAFSRQGLDRVTKQWMRLFVPERLAIDLGEDPGSS